MEDEQDIMDGEQEFNMDEDLDQMSEESLQPQEEEVTYEPVILSNQVHSKIYTLQPTAPPRGERRDEDAEGVGHNGSPV